MSLDTVVEDIKEQAQTRAEEIREDAESGAEEILAEARADAERIREDAEAEAEREAEREREQRLSAAELEAKQERLAARRDLLDEAYERSEAALADLEEDRREELTSTLLEAALEEIDVEEGAEVYARPEDEALVTSLCAEYDGAEYAGEYDCIGGVVVESEASRVRVNNTFDALFEDTWEDNLQTISKSLFEQ